MTIGQRLHNLRLACGLSPEEFAERVGVSVTRARAYEQSARLSPKTLDRIAEALDAPISALLDGVTMEADPTKNLSVEVAKMVPTAVLCDQLAEECCELGHAALKLSRVLRGENPTPVTQNDALRNLAEELADVTVCISVLCQHENMSTDAAVARKLERWLERLAGRTVTDA